MAVAAEVPQPEKQPTLKVKGVCERCGKVATKHSRKGYTWRCECGFVNMGPGYHAQDRTPPEGTRRRIARRELAAERRAEQGSAVATKPAGTPAPAPVRRRRTTTAAAGAESATPARNAQGPAQPVAGTAAPSSPPRRGLLDRFLYGGDE